MQRLYAYHEIIAWELSFSFIRGRNNFFDCAFGHRYFRSLFAKLIPEQFALGEGVSV